MLLEPSFNLRIGIWYLGTLHREFGSPVMALAAYNGGRGRVRRWLEEGIWDGREHTISSIPYKETRDFIRRVQYYRRWYGLLYGRMLPL